MKKLVLLIIPLLLLGFQSNAQISATDSVEVTGTNSYADCCRGFDFIPQKDIYIQEFGKRVPNTTGNYTWIIWEVNTQTKIYEQISTQSAATTYIYENSDSIIKLDSGITYSMSMYCDNSTGAQYYFGASSQIDPNLTYVAMRFCNSCPTSTFPTSLHASAYHYGTPDFIFECYSTPVIIIDSACGSYTSPSGNHIWTTSGIYNDTIEKPAVCDSIFTVDLLIKTVDTSVVKNGVILSANAIGATYQWIDCNTLTPIAGDTLQIFTPTVNGTYAVIVTENGCTDTSSCYLINSMSIDDQDVNQVKIYPNPTSDNFVIELDKTYHDILVKINNTLGEIVFEKTYTNTKNISVVLNEKAGVYFVSVHYDGSMKLIKLIKN
jgi:Secretion system C-terminal sorting domain